MEILISLLIICAIVAVLIWLINQITFGPAILQQILIAIVVIFAIIKVLPMLGVSFWIFGKRRYYRGQAFIATAAFGSLFSHNVLEQRPFLILFGILLTNSWLEMVEHSRHVAAYQAYLFDQQHQRARLSPGGSFDASVTVR